MNVLDAIRGRHCFRAYLPRPVERDTLHEILDAARWAPSGVNSQPWQVAVVQGDTRQRLSEALIAARRANRPENPDYAYYPEEWREPYRTRRKVCGLTMYQALGIDKHDKAARLEAWIRNYRFFDAPVGLLFLIDRGMQTGSWLDMGMFMQNIMLAAREFELGTCPQASLAEYPDIVREVLAIPADKLVLCGMALGYPDPDAPVNQYRLEREPVENFTRWYD
ncbi:MAG: nitroreductase [Alphaproteobacteria bacterium]